MHIPLAALEQLRDTFSTILPYILPLRVDLPAELPSPSHQPNTHHAFPNGSSIIVAPQVHAFSTIDDIPTVTATFYVTVQVPLHLMGPRILTESIYAKHAEDETTAVDSEHGNMGEAPSLVELIGSYYHEKDVLGTGTWAPDIHRYPDAVSVSSDGSLGAP